MPNGSRQIATIIHGIQEESEILWDDLQIGGTGNYELSAKKL